MNSSLLLQQCPVCLARLTWIVFVMGGRCPYSLCFVGYWLQDLFNIARNILEYLLSSFFSSRFVSVQVVHTYSSIDMAAAWKKLHFILLVNSDFHMTVSSSIAVHVFVSRVSMSFSVDEKKTKFYASHCKSITERSLPIIDLGVLYCIVKMTAISVVANHQKERRNSKMQLASSVRTFVASSSWFRF